MTFILLFIFIRQQMVERMQYNVKALLCLLCSWYFNYSSQQRHCCS